LETYVVHQTERVLPEIVCANKKGFSRLEISTVHLYGKVPLFPVKIARN